MATYLFHRATGHDGDLAAAVGGAEEINAALKQEHPYGATVDSARVLNDWAIYVEDLRRMAERGRKLTARLRR